ncbi:MAG: hypothetical protein JW867_03885, partial [Candidatus Omnitrophica bacterium]|nr:hypothetical protein [Candidatus Omnitrophota bacterium]
TLIELILVVAIVAILAGAIIPIVKGAVEDAKVAKILHLTETLKSACERYYADTAEYPREWHNSILAIPPPLLHDLYYANGVVGWDGPYISNPIDPDDNPYGEQIRVNDDMSAGDHPFDIDGDGIDERAGSGNVLYFYGVPESAAKKVNDIVDNHLNDNNWQSRGRVEYYPHFLPNWNCLAIHLLDGR